jgi:thiol:disulfide interchange protein DsbD
MRSFILLFLLGITQITIGQEWPFNWSGEVKYLEDEQVEIILECKVKEGWHVYSINNPEGGSIPLSVNIDAPIPFQVIQDWKEPSPKKEFEEVFNVEQWFHEGDFQIKSILRLKDLKENAKLNFLIENMACQTGQCTPPVKSEVTIEIDADLLEKESKSAWWVFWVGLGAGFLAILTPCVFPMVPMTVTFFTKQEGKKGISNAFLYGISIVVIYLFLGLGITLLFGEEAVYNMASSPLFNIIFFAVFLVFGFSFLGAFELQMPQSLVNKVDQKADKGGVIGVFFMAFTLALVSFSCTGPLIGSLLVEAAVEGGYTGPFLGMLGFSLALALPFTLFAIFPSWLNKLPKSGGWLNSVKVVLGLLELALALKFLSNADLVLQAGWLKREVFIALWIAIFIIMGLYLLGKIRFKHDSENQKLNVPRTLLATLTFAFVVYLIPGMFGAPLKMLSGVLPPAFYSEGWSLGISSLETKTKSVQIKECPNGLDCYHDYDEALKVAKEQNKPLMVDFTGWSCANCRLVEQNVWSNQEIDKLIREDFVLVSLYVDDRKSLPKEKQYVSKRNGKTIDTYGEKWKDLEVTRYKAITQPLYVLLDHNEEMLTEKLGYTINVQEYKSFLEDGLSAFKVKQINNGAIIDTTNKN